MQINIEQIKAKISKLSIDQIAKETNFEKRSPKKISAQEFVLSFFNLIHDGGTTLIDWAESFQDLTGKLISKQGINKKLQFRQEKFGLELLLKALKVVGESEQCHQQVDLFAPFANVYLEDSTCVSLPVNAADFFPGPHSTKQDKIATARIQLRLNLTKEQYEKCEVSGYRNNDQGFAYDIIDQLEQKDLVIRDLGYHVLGAFKAIHEKQAYFVSRYKYGVNIRMDQQQPAVDLLAMLKTEQRKGNQVVDTQVYLGEKKIPARLVAIKVPQNVEQARHRKAVKDRGSRTNHSEEYFALLGWAIYITNVPSQVWSAQQIFKAYACRWRIEIVFKCWKSHFKFDQFFVNKQSLNPARISITIYLLLVWLTLFFAKWYAYFAYKAYTSKAIHLSIQKFAKLLKKRFYQFWTAPDLEVFLEKVIYYCKYEKRKSPNFFDLLYYKNLS